MGYAAWAAVHAYIHNSWFNQYEEIYFLDSGHQSHAQKLHTQRHRENLFVQYVLVLARTITHHMEKELTLCCINLTTNCCRVPSPVYCLLKSLKKLQLIMPVVVATYAWGNGSSEGWIGGNSKVTHIFFLTNAEMSLG